jgi:hypothetical protein
MTPTSPSIAAGSERPLKSWLRRASAHPRGAELVLRGSLVLGAFCPDRARPAADVDYLVAGRFDAAATTALAHAIAALPDDGSALAVERTEVIWEETPFPGLRAYVVAADDTFQVDFAFGDPLSLPPRAVTIEGVGPVLGVAPETLFAWKLHGLVEFGRGRWRPKDLYDLDLLWAAVPLDRVALRAAVELAFGSRALPLSALDDFRARESWGTSRGSARKWRLLARRCQPGSPPGDFLEARARVRGAIDAVLAG